jgi:hypothetical protein
LRSSNIGNEIGIREFSPVDPGQLDEPDNFGQSPKCLMKARLEKSHGSNQSDSEIRVKGLNQRTARSKTPVGYKKFRHRFALLRIGNLTRGRRLNKGN